MSDIDEYNSDDNNSIESDDESIEKIPISSKKINITLKPSGDLEEETNVDVDPEEEDLIGNNDNDLDLDNEYLPEDDDDLDDDADVEDDDEDNIEDDYDMEGGADIDEKKKKKSKEKVAVKSKTKSLVTNVPSYNYNTDDDDDEEEDDNYLQKFDSEINKNYILDYHPECSIHNYDEISILTHIIRDNNNIIIDDLHKTVPFLTKYEKARVLGQRAKQINSGAKAFVKIPENVIDGYIIAELELQQKRIPFIIRRPIPGGGSEYWNLRDLEIIHF
jgi:DNA-directed RNA polymerase I, II, and III subunit RPABC2